MVWKMFHTSFFSTLKEFEEKFSLCIILAESIIYFLDFILFIILPIIVISIRIIRILLYLHILSVCNAGYPFNTIFSKFLLIRFNVNINIRRNAFFVCVFFFFFCSCQADRAGALPRKLSSS